MAPRLALCLGLLAALATAAAGCVVSPQPSPPDLVLDDDRIGLHPGTGLVNTLIDFEASAGAVHPAEGVVVITNLDTTDAPSFAKVEPDGSFALAVPGTPGQTFRFQAKSGAQRSQPFDFVVSTGGEAIDNAVEATPCLTLDPARWVALDGASDARSIVIRNQCSGAVSLGAPHLRRGLAGFSFTPTTPFTIAAGKVATITVKASAGAEREDVLVLDITAPEPSHRAITLTVPDP
jgi:hypothetical protein